MSIHRQWRIACDHPHCRNSLDAPGNWSRSEFGMMVNDAGWQAAPSVDKTFCPHHWLPDDEFDKLVEEATKDVLIQRRPKVEARSESFDSRPRHRFKDKRR